MKKALVIGTGSVAQKHIKILKSLKYEVHVFSETNNYFFIQNPKVRRINNLKNLKNFYFAIIANKTSDHLKTLNLLLREGIHIYCEKPIYHKRFNFDEIRNLIKKKNLIFHNGYQLRQDTKIKYLIKKLNSNKTKNYKIKSFLFSVGHDFTRWRKNGVRIDSYFSNTNKGGGVIFELIHEINLINLLFGKIRKISTLKSKSNKFNCEDVAISLIKMKNNIIGTLYQDMFSKVFFRKIQIVTNKTTFEVDMVKNLLIENDRVKKFKNTNSQIDLLRRNIIKFINRIVKKDYSLKDYDSALLDLNICLKMHNAK
jgi:predicted dehydrogenase